MIVALLNTKLYNKIDVLTSHGWKQTTIEEYHELNNKTKLNKPTELQIKHLYIYEI